MATVKKNIQQTKNIFGKENTTRLVWIYAIALFLFAFLLYGQTLNYGFVLDDGVVIQKNTFVQKGIKGIPEIMSHGFLAGLSKESDLIRPQYRPLVLVQFALEKEYFGDSPFAYHFFNVFYYALTGVLLFLLLRKMFGSKSPAIPLLISMLFLAHPVHTEVVANIKSRDEIMCFLFLLASLLSLHQYTLKRKKLLLITSIVAYFLAFLSKETALTFLAVIPLFLYCFTKEKLKDIFRITTPYLVAAAIIFILRTIILEKGLPHIDPLYNALLAIPTFSHRLATAILIIGKYFRILLYPHPLVWDYSYNQIPETGWNNPYVILTLILIIALSIYALLKLKSRQILSFGILFFIITMSVTSNIVFYIGSTMGERFLYTPSLGFCIVLFFVIKNVLQVNFSQNNFNATFFYLIMIFVLAGYTFKTINRSQAWKNNFTLFMAGIQDSPNSSKTHLSLAGELNNYAQGAPDSATASQLHQKAIEEYYKGLNIYPQNAEGWSTLGVAYLNYKKLDSAQYAFERATAVDTAYVRAYNNIGAIQAFKGNYKNAITYFEKAAALDSTYADALGNIAGCYNNLKEYQLADTYYNKALKIDPGNEGIKRNMEANQKMFQENGKLKLDNVK